MLKLRFIHFEFMGIDESIWDFKNKSFGYSLETWSATIFSGTKRRIEDTARDARHINRKSLTLQIGFIIVL